MNTLFAYISNIKKDNMALLAAAAFILIAAIFKPSDRDKISLPGNNLAAVHIDTVVQTECLTIIKPPAPATVSPTKAKPPAPVYKPKYIKINAERRKQGNAYIKRFSQVARDEQKAYNIPASISMAQGILETQFGTSRLCRENNNHFGIKCFSKKCKKGHCTNHTDDSHKDFFVKYASAWSSWRDHSKKLSTARYKKLKGKGWLEYAAGLSKCGYATDPHYAAKLEDIIMQFELYKLDK